MLLDSKAGNRTKVLINDAAVAEAIKTVSEYFGDALKAVQPSKPIVEWAESDFIIPETESPIKLEPVQKVFLNYAFANDATTWIYSTIKKAGKTAISGLVGRYIAENSGSKAEVYFVANDKEQAKDRAYEAAKTSIELTPGYDRGKRVLSNKWKVIERQCMHEPTGSLMRAIASDYEGAAGANPTITLWTELWAFTSERMKRLWDEMTPVPTRRRSIRYVETYAGFEDESEILYDLYKIAVLGGRRLERSELEPYGGWPYADEPPFYVNQAARTFAYWDTGPQARRMPWQQGPAAEAYYKEQAALLREDAFERLHFNYWKSSSQPFIQEAWWHADRLPVLLKAELERFVPRNYPVVVGVDASVSGDCTAIVGVSRFPDGFVLADGSRPNSEHDLWLRFASVFVPPAHGTIDFAAVKQTIVDYCGQYNVVCLPYDMYQLHQMMQELAREGVVWCKKFSQASDREVADADLYNHILNRHIWHCDEFEARYITNAAAYVGVNASNKNKLQKLRIVKKGKDNPVDPVVALSMACYEAMRLNLT